MADEKKNSGPPKETWMVNQSPERQRELRSMGGKASAAVQRQKRNFQQAIKWAMDMPAQDILTYNDKLINLLVKQFPDMTAAEAMAIKTTRKAIQNGDAKALAILRDSVGELPSQTVKLQQNDPVSITIRTLDGEAPVTDGEALSIDEASADDPIPGQIAFDTTYEEESTDGPE